MNGNGNGLCINSAKTGGKEEQDERSEGSAGIGDCLKSLITENTQLEN